MPTADISNVTLRWRPSPANILLEATGTIPGTGAQVRPTLQGGGHSSVELLGRLLRRWGRQLELGTKITAEVNQNGTRFM